MLLPQRARLRVLHHLRKADADVVGHVVQQDAVNDRLRRRVQERVHHRSHARARRVLGVLRPRRRAHRPACARAGGRVGALRVPSGAPFIKHKNAMTFFIHSSWAPYSSRVR